MPEYSLCFVCKNRSRQQLGSGRVLTMFPNCIRSVVAGWAGGGELVIVDYASDDWPVAEWVHAETGDIPVKVVQLSGEFSKGKGLNAAAENASSPSLFFIDADMLVPAGLVQDCVQRVQAGGAAAPLFFDENENGTINRALRTRGFGNIACSRDVWERAGGCPEFYSWGGEDTLFYERVRGLVRTDRWLAPGFIHQWHPTGAWKSRYYTRPAGYDWNRRSVKGYA